MREQYVSRIMIITTVMSTFVLYLCAGVSKLLPFFIAIALIAYALVSAGICYSPVSELVRGTQKRE